jgi:hypothetical protein
MVSIATALLFAMFGREKRVFSSRLLTSRINFSLNTLLRRPDGTYTLLLRTLREVNAKSLMPNTGSRALCCSPSFTHAQAQRSFVV